MSNKPSIYAFCPAGCKWETVHKSDVPFKEVLISRSQYEALETYEGDTMYIIYDDEEPILYLQNITYDDIYLESPLNSKLINYIDPGIYSFNIKEGERYIPYMMYVSRDIYNIYQTIYEYGESVRKIKRVITRNLSQGVQTSYIEESVKTFVSGDDLRALNPTNPDLVIYESIGAVHKSLSMNRLIPQVKDNKDVIGVSGELTYVFDESGVSKSRIVEFSFLCANSDSDTDTIPHGNVLTLVDSAYLISFNLTVNINYWGGHVNLKSYSYVNFVNFNNDSTILSEIRINYLNIFYK